MTINTRTLNLVMGVAIGIALLGCGSKSSKNSVVVYTAVDAEVSESILREFTTATGVEALPKFDAESTKTVGLVQAIIAEAQRPRCDVFWNNEILNTLRLEERGLLEVYRSPLAAGIPRQSQSPRGTWQGFAARARILLVNSDLVSQGDRPRSIFDLASAKWKGRTGVAKPLFGTTATHAACLFTALGEARARQFFLDLKTGGVQVLAGNKQVAQAVSAGQLAFGLTDTDDAMGEIESGNHVAIVYPDQAVGELGTLFIPNTLAIVKGCPHPQEARRLVDHLLSPEVEKRLAEGPSAQIPLNPQVKANVRVETPRTVKAMQVDFDAAAQQWDAAALFLQEQFTGAD